MRFDSFLAVRCGLMKVLVGVPLPLPLHLGGACQRGGCGLLVGWCSIFFSFELLGFLSVGLYYALAFMASRRLRRLYSSILLGLRGIALHRLHLLWSV